MEAYKKVGRGGAGNFYSKKDVEDAVKSRDLEFQNPTNAQSPTISSNPPSEYLHSGRGGAGNWFQPSELQSNGLSQNTADNNPTSTVPTTKRVVGQSKPAYRGGRGGAGNYIDTAEDERLIREAEERKREEMQGRVERDVEAGLARPERAYGGYGAAFEMK